MSKFENFSQRLSYHQQQIESDKLRRKVITEQKWREDKDRQALEKIRAQNEAIERVNKTKEIFRGTGILESFQEIIDSRILTFATIGEDSYRRGWFGMKIRNGTQEIIPAKIRYQLNQVDLRYNAWIAGGSDYEPEYYTCKTISVARNEDSSFKLTLPEYDLSKYEKLTSEETIDRIAEFIASGKAESNYENNFHVFGKKALMNYYGEGEV